MIYDDFYIESKNVRNRMKERRIIDNLGDAVYKVKEGYKYRRDGNSSGRYDRENKTYTISTDIDSNKKSIPIGRIKVSGSSAMPSKKIRDKINNIKWKKESEEEWKKFKNESEVYKMSKLSREEFESILEECFIEGYNSALEDIQEDILDEEAYDLEDDYYNEGVVTDSLKDKVNNVKDDVKAFGRAMKSGADKRAYKNFYKGSNGVKAKRAKYNAIKNSKDVPDDLKQKYKKEYEDALADYEKASPNKFKIIS